MNGYIDLVDTLLGFSSENNEAEKKEEIYSTVTAVDMVIEGDVEGLRQLLKCNSDYGINGRNSKTGRSLLHEACARGQTNITKFLLHEMKANLTLCTMLGRCTPLHLAVANNHQSVVLLLLSHGADPLSRDRFACSPMHYVNSLSVAKLLVQYGGQVLDYNAKKKDAVDSFVESFQKSQSLSSAGREAAMKVDKDLVKYLEKQAETEYKLKLEKLRKLKAQTTKKG